MKLTKEAFCSAVGTYGLSHTDNDEILISFKTLREVKELLNQQGLEIERLKKELRTSESERRRLIGRVLEKETKKPEKFVIGGNCDKRIWRAN